MTDPIHAIDEMTRRLVDDGATAVVLTGSHARRASGPESDIDVTAIADGPISAHLEVLGGEERALRGMDQ